MTSLVYEKYLQNQPKTLLRITWLFSHPVVLKMGHPRPLFRLFSVFFKQTSIQLLQQINVNKCPSIIQCWDLNPQPSQCKSHPITTRSGLPPDAFKVYCSSLVQSETTKPLLPTNVLHANKVTNLLLAMNLIPTRLLTSFYQCGINK